MDIAACVDKLYRDPAFKGSATIRDRADWEAREWIDGRGKKPTWAQLEAIWPVVELEIAPPDTEREEKISAEMRRMAEAELIKRGEISG